MGKLLVHDQEAREALQRGINTLTRAVRSTLGPKGCNVALGKAGGPPLITHDGVTVAEDIDLKDVLENMGAQLLKEAASKTNEAAGDGTTTATVLANSLVNEGLRAVAAGADPVILKQGIAAATAAVVQHVREHSRPVAEQSGIAEIASISSADRAIGALIAEVLQRVGADGTITVEAGNRTSTEVRYVEGMEIEQGFVSAHFITDAERRQAVIENPLVFVTDRRLTTIDDVAPLLEILVTADRRDVLIVADDVIGDALATLVANTVRGVIRSVAIKAPFLGERRFDILMDIATLTGAELYSTLSGRQLDYLAFRDLGSATRIMSNADTTVIVGGGGSADAIRSRINALKVQLSTATNFHVRERLEQRIGKLSGGVAVIHVGASSEVEIKEKKARIEDALAAARAAAAEGVVPGGGVALLNATAALDHLDAEGDARIGVSLLRRALEEPARQIALNGGGDGSVVVDAIRARQAAAQNNNIGYNTITDAYEDLMDSGVIDSAKVTRIALENASSIAQMVLTTETLVAECRGAAGARP